MSRWDFNKHGHTLVVTLACCLVVLLIIVALLEVNDIQKVFTSENATTPTVAKNPDAIAIPGYEMLELKADVKKQTTCLPNPPQNDCYFQIRLYLENGTLLWESELIEPGKTSKPITLTATLKKGTYPNSLLHYSCYRMDEYLTPLNAAEIKITLRVK